MQSIKNLSLIGTSDILGMIFSSVFWFYLASQISAEQFGEIHFLLSAAGIAYGISLFGTPTVITVYTAKKIKLSSTLCIVSLITGSISCMIISAIYYRIDVGLIVLAFIINDLSIAYLLGRKSYGEYSKFFVTQKFLTLALGLGFFYLLGVDGIIYGLILSYIHFIIIIFKMLKESKVDLQLLKEKKYFVTNNYILNLIGNFRANLDKIIIVPLIGLVALGNYALAMQAYGVLMIFPGIVYKYILTHDSSNNPNKKLKIFTVCIVTCIGILGFTVLPLIIPILFPKYVEAIEAVRILSLGIIPATVGLIFSSKFLGKENSKTVLISRIIRLTSMIVGIIILGNIFGLVGIAASFVLSSTMSTLFLVYSNWRNN